MRKYLGPAVVAWLPRIAVLGLVGGCTAEVGGGTLPAPPRGDSAGNASGAAAGASGVAPSGGAMATGGASAGGGTASVTEFPCDVQRLLAQKCLACHKADPPGSLLTAADFRRPSSDPSKTIGQEALERLAAATVERMPPAPLAAATPEEVAAFSAWISAGAQATGCGQAEPVAPDPYDTPVVCTSATQWTGGNRESPLMRPGGACITCHEEENEGPSLAIGGTVYPTPHEPNDCNGVQSASGAKVVITDASGAVHTLDVNDAGNFFLETANFAYPYQAKVTYQGRERVMVKAQDQGDCNDCHTQAGREGAPGRVFLP